MLAALQQTNSGARRSTVCSACHAVGHRKSSQVCPKYAEYVGHRRATDPQRERKREERQRLQQLEWQRVSVTHSRVMEEHRFTDEIFSGGEVASLVTIMARVRRALGLKHGQSPSSIQLLDLMLPEPVLAMMRVGTDKELRARSKSLTSVPELRVFFGSWLWCTYFTASFSRVHADEVRCDQWFLCRWCDAHACACPCLSDVGSADNS